MARNPFRRRLPEPTPRQRRRFERRLARLEDRRTLEERLDRLRRHDAGVEIPEGREYRLAGTWQGPPIERPPAPPGARLGTGWGWLRVPALPAQRRGGLRPDADELELRPPGTPPTMRYSPAYGWFDSAHFPRREYLDVDGKMVYPAGFPIVDVAEALWHDGERPE